MSQQDMLSINTVAAKLGLSVHQLRRWELMFGLEIKRGRGQQRQYRQEDLTVLERIKELVEQGWPTTQIRPQLEAEGLITPKLIGVPQQPGNPEMLMEAIIGLRSFSERRFIEISKQIDELRQLMISITLRNELKNEISSPWQPVEEEFAPTPADLPAEEISIGPSVNVMMPSSQEYITPKPSVHTFQASQFSNVGGFQPEEEVELEEEEEIAESMELEKAPEPAESDFTPVAEAPDLESLQTVEEAALEAGKQDELEIAQAPAPQIAPAPLPPKPSPVQTKQSPPRMGLGEVTDQNYLTLLGRALDMIGWSDEQADQYSQDTFGVSHWDELGRSQAEKLIEYLVSKMSSGDPAAI